MRVKRKRALGLWEGVVETRNGKGRDKIIFRPFCPFSLHRGPFLQPCKQMLWEQERKALFSWHRVLTKSWDSYHWDILPGMRSNSQRRITPLPKYKSWAGSDRGASLKSQRGELCAPHDQPLPTLTKGSPAQSCLLVTQWNSSSKRHLCCVWESLGGLVKAWIAELHPQSFWFESNKPLFLHVADT